MIDCFSMQDWQGGVVLERERVRYLKTIGEMTPFLAFHPIFYKLVLLS